MRALVIVLILSALVIAAPASGKGLPEIKKDCSICHSSWQSPGPAPLKEKLSALCLGCHSDRIPKGDHKVDVIPYMKVNGLPLDADGKMTCATCHDPHGNTPHKALLREDPKLICNLCHKK